MKKTATILLVCGFVSTAFGTQALNSNSFLGLSAHDNALVGSHVDRTASARDLS
jgi:hypothetical protein